MYPILSYWEFIANNFSVKFILEAGFAGQGILSKEPTVWQDEARPRPIKSNCEFGNVKF